MYTQNEKIIPRDIEEEVKDSYLNYAMSVIVGRALPDVKDGLKPVHRRILYAMHELNLEHVKPYKKSARIVGECFVKDTLILTKKGLLPIQDIKRGDLVYTQKDIGRVSELYEMPPQKLLRATLENGVCNEVTPSQRFRVLNKDLGFIWKEARNLTAEDYIVARSYYPDIKDLVELKSPYLGTKRHLNKNIAYLLGFFISDGWITNDYSKSNQPRIGFYSTNRNVIEKVADILIQEFDYAPTIELRKYKVRGKNGIIQNTGYIIRINRLDINEFFVNNFDLAIKNAFTKEIPPQIFVSPQKIIFSFISGLIEGDGSVHSRKNVIHYGSVSKKLINQLAILLQHLGIFSSKYRNESLKRGGFIDEHYIKANYRFNYLEFRGSSALLLAKSIALFDETKQNRVERLLTIRKFPFSHDIIPYSGQHIFKELSKWHIGSGWYEDINGEKFRMGIKYPTGCKIRYSSDLSEKPLRKSQIIEWGIRDKLKRIDSPLSHFVEEIVEKDIYFLKIASVKEISAQKTYDLQVEKEHEFIANGMLSHNCLGKYHPHGDIAVYDALTRMAQDFSLRYPLVDGQGNFGSVDGDPAAAQRYTEARLAAISGEMLADIDKNTVNFMPNFDASLLEPVILPARIPNLLISGSSGIAVGMATNMSPHNLGEVLEASIYLIDNPDAETKNLMRYVRGPDFPTGGLICGRQGIKQAYETGRGKLTIRAVASIEHQKQGKDSIVITEIPYQVNKANLIESIAALVEAKKIEGISDIRDESDKEGIRIVVELKRDVEPQIILNQLFKHTQLEITFGIINLALVDGRPQVLNLKQLLSFFINHRKEIIRRRTQFDLDKAERRAHILEGLKIALKHIDRIIKIIKTSKNTQEAKHRLIKEFSLTDIQAQAILEMQLQRLTGLERSKIEAEYLELIKRIQVYKSILASEKKIEEIIKDECLQLQKKYADERRTQIVAEVEEIELEDLIAEEDMVITISHLGYVKRLSVSSYRKQRRGGRGVTAMETREEDFVKQLFVASSKDYLLIFTNKGKAYWLKVYEIPEASRTAKGKAVVNLLALSSGERINSVVAVKEFTEDKYLMMCTKQGLVKKTRLSCFSNPRKAGIVAIGLGKDDYLVETGLADGKQRILLATREGKSVLFHEKQIRDMGRAARGVRGIKLGKKDEIVGMEVLPTEAEKMGFALLTVTTGGFAKRTDFSEYRLQSRGGKGIINIKTTSRNGEVAGVSSVNDEDEIMAVTQKGMIVRCPIKDIRQTGRSTQGVRLISLDKDDAVACIAKVVAKEE